MGRSEGLSTSKKLTVLVFVLFLAFVGVNVFWAVTMYIPYCGYSYALAEKDDEYPTLVESGYKNGYGYTISKTQYLGYDDFLRVAVETSSLEKDIVVYGVFVYPNIWGKYEYVVSCFEDGNLYIMFEIDEFGEFIPLDSKDVEFNEKAQSILNEKNGEIMNFIKAAKDMWGLEAKHDLEMGVKALIKGHPVASLLQVVCYVFVFLFIVCFFIWRLKYRLPFQIFNNELNVQYGTSEISYRRIVGDYELCTSNPQFFRNNGFLMIQKQQFSVERIRLVIYPQKDKILFFIVLNDLNDKIRKSEKIELEYIGGKVLSRHKLVTEYSDEVENLIVQAKLFWPI